MNTFTGIFSGLGIFYFFFFYSSGLYIIFKNLLRNFKSYIETVSCDYFNSVLVSLPVLLLLICLLEKDCWVLRTSTHGLWNLVLCCVASCMMLNALPSFPASQLRRSSNSKEKAKLLQGKNHETCWSSAERREVNHRLSVKAWNRLQILWLLGTLYKLSSLVAPLTVSEGREEYSSSFLGWTNCFLSSASKRSLPWSLHTAHL